jgi:YidC/Oxa1 family membrane protein insertase
MESDWAFAESSAATHSMRAVTTPSDESLNMAEQENKQPPKSPDKKQISMEQRMLLAFALMGIVLFASQYLYKAPDPKNTVKPVQSATPQQAKPPAPAAEQPTAVSTAPGTAVTAAKPETYTIDTNVYKLVFSNHGAVVRSWQLKQYRDGTGKPLELVNAAAAPKTHYPLSLVFESQKPSTDVNQALYVAKLTPDGLGIDFDFADGKVSTRKTVRFRKDSYLAEVTSEVRENGAGIPHMIAWRGGFGDRTVAAAAATQKTLYFDTSQNKLIENNVGHAKNGPQTSSGSYSFAGVEDTYFAAVFLPKEPRSVKIQTMSDTAAIAEGQGEEPLIGAAVGGDARNVYSLFVGPKDVDLLKTIDPKLEQVVDFGWFSFIAKPLFLMLNWLHDKHVHNYGWSIVIATILINCLLLPLKLSGMKSMKKMSSLQPEIAKINEKYKNIGIRDPKKQDQQAEVMELYKKHGVNPLNVGCMPLLVQIPFFFAFYKVLSQAIELRGESWLWVSDLSQPETIAIRILPLVMIGSQFVMQKMTPSTTADPAQQKMMLFLPLVMGFMFYGVPSGLVLYWVTGNVVGIVQQWFMNRTMPAPATAPVVSKAPAKRVVRK